MVEILLVGFGGFIGSVARFLVSKAFAAAHITFPAATLLVNAAACFAIGFAFGVEQARPLALSGRTRSFIKAGVLGGLSTFSAFSLETVNLWANQKYFMAAANVSLSLVISLFACAAGVVCAKTLLRDL